jgi:hypothetical protein
VTTPTVVPPPDQAAPANPPPTPAMSGSLGKQDSTAEKIPPAVIASNAENQDTKSLKHKKQVKPQNHNSVQPNLVDPNKETDLKIVPHQAPKPTHFSQYVKDEDKELEGLKINKPDTKQKPGDAEKVAAAIAAAEASAQAAAKKEEEHDTIEIDENGMLINKQPDQV